jgi:hypothetical protein
MRRQRHPGTARLVGDGHRRLRQRRRVAEAAAGDSGQPCEFRRAPGQGRAAGPAEDPLLPALGIAGCAWCLAGRRVGAEGADRRRHVFAREIGGPAEGRAGAALTVAAVTDPVDRGLAFHLDRAGAAAAFGFARHCLSPVGVGGSMRHLSAE